MVWRSCLGWVTNETQTKTYQNKQETQRPRPRWRSPARCSAPRTSSSVGSTRARGLHYVAATPQAALATGLLRCQIRRGLDESGLRAATSAAPIPTRSAGAAPIGRPTCASCTPERSPWPLPRPPASFGCTSSGLVWSEPVLSGAVRAGAWTAHKRVRVCDVGRLVRPSEADPVYLSYNRPCLRINRSRHLKWRILETVSPPVLDPPKFERRSRCA